MPLSPLSPVDTRHQFRPVSAELVALLPKGAKITTIAPVEDRIVVTLDVNGATEIRTFDLRTLRPTGRLRFANEP